MWGGMFLICSLQLLERKQEGGSGVGDGDKRLIQPEKGAEKDKLKFEALDPDDVCLNCSKAEDFFFSTAHVNWNAALKMESATTKREEKNK